MKAGAQRQVNVTPTKIAARAAKPMHSLQRKCACGGTGGLTGECAECRRKRLLGGRLQTKLRVNRPGDRYEREADHIAEQVMRMPESTHAAIPEATEIVQRQRGDGASETAPFRNDARNQDGMRLPPQPSTMTSPVQRQSGGLRQMGVGAVSLGNRETPGYVPDVTQSTESQIHSLRGRGEALPAATRGFLEPRFGRDLAGIRIHTDQTSGELAARLQSRAFTLGSDIFFAGGEYEPRTSNGMRLLCHELTHAVQQGMVPASQASPVAKPDVTIGAAGSLQREVNPKRISTSSAVLNKIKRIGDSYRDLGKIMGPQVANMARFGKFGIGFNPGATKDEKDNAFVYTCKCGWIDMGHFFISAAAAYGTAYLRQFKSLKLPSIPVPGGGKVCPTDFPEELLETGMEKLRPVLAQLLKTVGSGNLGPSILSDLQKLLESGEPRDIGLAFGYWMEFLQQVAKLATDPMKNPPEALVGAQRSAFTIEDLPSDCFGADLGQRVWQMVNLAPDDSSPVHDMMQKFFSQCGAVFPQGKTRCEMMAETTPGSCRIVGGREVWAPDGGTPRQYTSTKPYLLKSAKPICKDATPLLCESGGGSAEKTEEAQPASTAGEDFNRFLLFRGFTLRAGPLTRFGAGLTLPSDLHVDNFFMTPLGSVGARLRTGAVDLSLKRKSLSVTLLDPVPLNKPEVRREPGQLGRLGRLEEKAPYVLRGPTILSFDSEGNFSGTSSIAVPGLGDTKVVVGGNLTSGQIRAQAGGPLFQVNANAKVRIDFRRLFKGLVGPEVDQIKRIFKSDEFEELVKKVLSRQIELDDFLDKVKALLKADFPLGLEGSVDIVLGRLEQEFALATSVTARGTVSWLGVPTSVFFLHKSPGLNPLWAAEFGLLTSDPLGPLTSAFPFSSVNSRKRVVVGAKSLLYGERMLQAQATAGVDLFSRKMFGELHAESEWTSKKLGFDKIGWSDVALEGRYERGLEGDWAIFFNLSAKHSWLGSKK